MKAKGVVVIGGNDVKDRFCQNLRGFYDAIEVGNFTAVNNFVERNRGYMKVCDALVPAAIGGDLKIFMYLSAESFREKGRSVEMNQALLHAAKTGNHEIVSYIVESSGESVNEMLAFQTAIQYGQESVVRYFVEWRDMKFGLTEEFRSCFNWVLVQKHLPVLYFLVEKFNLKVDFLPSQMGQVRIHVREAMATA